MIKTIKTMSKQEKERYTVPRKVQDVIPVRRIWPDGIFLVGNKFSKTYKFSDINYLVASREDKESMFLTYSELLNSLDSGAVTKITINNRRMNQANFETSILMPMQGDFRDEYRGEYNQMLLDKATGANGIMQEKYITISVVKKDIEEARAYFSRVGADLISHFAALGSKCVELDATERLRILHDFYRQGEESEFVFNAREMMKRGHSFKDYICPDGIEKKSDYLKLGGKFCRVLFLKDYASYIKDNMVTELTDFNRNLMFSIDIVPVPTDEAVREVENRLLGVETNITNWQRRQNANNNFSAVVPYDMELQRKESKEFLDDLTTRDQRMMFAVMTLAITADTKEQLDSDTEAVLSVARKHMCQLAVLKFQQLDGLNTALPIGVRKINAFRTLTTESLAVFIPFKVQEIQDKGGIYFGENAISHNLIMCNKANLLNQSAFLLGVPGAGKSFSAKELIAFLMLHPDYANDDILICDPEGEFGALVKALGREKATVAHLVAGGKDRLNAMYMVEGYGEQNPIVEKSQFVMSLIEQIDKRGVGPQHKSIIDRCTALVYPEAENAGRVATLCDLRQKLLEQPEDKAREIALSLELYTTGSLDIFGRESTVDLNKPYVVFDIHGLGEQLKPAGSLVITDTILNRVTLNWKRGKRTHVFIDEFHVMFENEQSGIFFNSAWRQFRKRGAYPTAITQNVEYLLDSVQASTMLSNSEFIVMLNQAASDRAKLAKLLNISNEQMSYVTNADAGCGLIRYSKFTGAINFFHDSTLAWWKQSWLWSAVIQAVMPTTLLGTLPIGAWLYMTGTLPLSDFITCIILPIGFIAPLMRVGKYSEQFNMVKACLDQIRDFIEKPKLKRPEKNVALDETAYRFENVSFAYNETEVLKNVSFEIKPGTVSAIVGPSGSGKSTIAKLMAGFWDATKGKVIFGGKNIKEIPFAQLMGEVSYVAQDNFLFDESIRENIRLGKPDATDDEVVAAAKAACCHEFIVKLENGYDTNAGDAGGKLSGGERQRITIARAILKNARVIILDEATAYADPENEYLIQNAISKLVKGKTLIVVAHRLATIQKADQILVVENGKIVGCGRQEELLSECPLYQRLWSDYVSSADQVEGGTF